MDLPVVQQVVGAVRNAAGDDLVLQPAWALNKSETLEKIRQTLAKRDSWQGMLLNK